MSTTFANPGTITMLQERVAAGVGRVDREAGVIRGVRILGRVSRNGREYLPQAISNAKPLYEGINVNCDHPSSARNDRRVSDRIGWLQNVREADNGLRGDLHLLKSHPLTASVLEAAERRPQLLGLSHNAEGRITKRDGKTLVEEITRVRSVDLVADPATASSLFESHKWSVDAMTSSEFAARLLENDGEGFAPAADPVDSFPAGDDKAKADADLRKLQKQILDMVQTAQSVDGLLRDLAKLVGDRGLPVLDPSGLASAAESLDPYSFASSITENARGSRRPFGRDPSAAFAARLFD